MCIRDRSFTAHKKLSTRMQRHHRQVDAWSGLVVTCQRPVCRDAFSSRLAAMHRLQARMSYRIFSQCPDLRARLGR
eukprot:7367251-Pyramimonas_sp.AAC.1